jgi:hypothetical protein
VARVPARWDDDDRGRGVSDARRLVPRAEELASALTERDCGAAHTTFVFHGHIVRVAGMFAG